MSSCLSTKEELWGWCSPKETVVVKANLTIYTTVSLGIHFQGPFPTSEILGCHALPHEFDAKMEELHGCRHICEQMVIPTAVSK